MHDTAEQPKAVTAADPQSWIDLLSTLTDEELSRYAEVVEDQRVKEFEHLWAQIALTLAGLVSLVFMVRGVLIAGPQRSSLLLAALAAGLIYWPYRRARIRSLWRGHATAVERERRVRAAAGERR